MFILSHLFLCFCLFWHGRLKKKFLIFWILWFLMDFLLKCTLSLTSDLKYKVVFWRKSNVNLLHFHQSKHCGKGCVGCDCSKNFLKLLNFFHNTPQPWSRMTICISDWLVYFVFSSKRKQLYWQCIECVSTHNTYLPNPQ